MAGAQCLSARLLEPAWTVQTPDLASAFFLLAKKARTAQGERGAFVVKGRVSNPSPASVQVVIRGTARCASQVPDRVAQAVARSATHVLDRGVQAVARGAGRYASQVLGRGAKAAASGAGRYAS